MWGSGFGDRHLAGFQVVSLCWESGSSRPRDNPGHYLTTFTKWKGQREGIGRSGMADDGSIDLGSRYSRYRRGTSSLSMAWYRFSLSDDTRHIATRSEFMNVNQELDAFPSSMNNCLSPFPRLGSLSSTVDCRFQDSGLCKRSVQPWKSQERCSRPTMSLLGNAEWARHLNKNNPSQPLPHQTPIATTKVRRPERTLPVDLALSTERIRHHSPPTPTPSPASSCAQSPKRKDGDTHSRGDV